MDAVVFDLTPDHPGFLVQIILILTVNEVDDWLPARERERERGGREGGGRWNQVKVGVKGGNRIPPALFPPDISRHFLVFGTTCEHAQ